MWIKRSLVRDQEVVPSHIRPQICKIMLPKRSVCHSANAPARQPCFDRVTRVSIQGNRAAQAAGRVIKDQNFIVFCDHGVPIRANGKGSGYAPAWQSDTIGQSQSVALCIQPDVKQYEHG